MTRLRLAVVSDLHIGRARSWDLCPYFSDECRARGSGFKCKIPFETETPRCQDEKYVDAFRDFVRDQELTADYLIVLGDLTHRGQPDEFQYATEVLQDIRAALAVAKSDVILVPGNHDVDWQVSALPDKTGVRFEQRFFPLAHKKWSLAKLMKRGAPKGWSCFGAPYFSLWSDEELLVVIYNSSWDDRKEKKVHHGHIDAVHLGELRAWLRRSAAPAKTKILAVHHHPVQYPNPFRDKEDFSEMDGATPQLLELMHENRFDLILHGHKHRPYFLPINSHAGQQIPILCAGSFSAIPDDRILFDAPNVFHIIELDEKAIPTDVAHPVLERGRVLTWAFDPARGWVRMHATEGIGGTEPFGTYVARDVLFGEIRAWVETELANTGRARSTELFQARPHLGYVERRVMSHVLDELKEAASLELSIPDDDPTGFVLTRRV